MCAPVENIFTYGISVGKFIVVRLVPSFTVYVDQYYIIYDVYRISSVKINIFTKFAVKLFL